MVSCEKMLVELVRDIEPTAAQKEGAQRSHNFLREILATGQMGKRIVDSYLSGSYPRDTAIQPLEDVDVIFVIAPDEWCTNPFDRLFSGHPEPETVLKSFLNAIRYRYQDSSLRLQNKSVRLRLNHLDIDVVPAIERGRNDGSILIPNREKEDWIVTAPKKHSETASVINQKQGGRFKPLVKLLKYWNCNLPSTARFKSFAVETLACRLFQRNRLNTLEEGLLVFFDFIAYLGDDGQAFEWNDSYGVSFDWFECNIPDIANTGSNVAAGTGESQKQRFIENATLTRNRLLEAQDSRTEEVAWRKMKQALRC
mgnify:FL=1